MSTIVTTLPQNATSIKMTTLSQVVQILPSTIPFPINVWIGGKMARYSQSEQNLIFLTDSETDPTNEQMEYFNTLVTPLGIQATLSRGWKNEAITAMRLYDTGNLIIDPTTLVYTKIPTQSIDFPMLTVQEAVSLLPKTIPWTYDLYLTGGLVLSGYSFHDADIVVLDPTVTQDELALMRKMFTDAIGWKVDVGQRIMVEREPPSVQLYLIYSGGNICLP